MQDGNPLEQASAAVHPGHPDPKSSAIEGVYRKIKEHGVRVIDFWFTELGGKPWRISMTADDLHDRIFSTGVVVDGRQIGGSWEGLITILPDPSATYLDPIAAVPTLSIMSDIQFASRERYDEDSRTALKRAEQHFRQAQVGMSWMVGAEVEFFLLEYGNQPSCDSALRELLRETWAALSAGEIRVDWFRTGPAKGQGRVQMHFGSALQTADQIMIYKSITRFLAARRGKTARFMPKPTADLGSAGMLVHHSFWRDGVNRFHDPEGWGYTSSLCRWFAGGMLKHGPALLAFCAPTMNSYRRLMPGGYGPTDLTLSKTSAAAACRVPAGTTGPVPAARRVKFCAADPAANPYLALSAMLMAGLDGIDKKIEPPIDQEGSRKRAPHSLEEALEALDGDRDFLKPGGVFNDRLINGWIANRWREEITPVRTVPHPVELELEACHG